MNAQIATMNSAIASYNSGDKIKIGLIGCGGRGSGAAVNALSVKSAPLKLVAMADVVAERIDRVL